MKTKILPVLAVFLLMSGIIFTAPPAYAMPLYFDLAGAGTATQGLSGLGAPIGDADAKTGVFKQISFYSETTVTQYDDNGIAGLNTNDTFVDNGSLYGMGMVPIGLDEEGLKIAWEFTSTFQNMGGYVSAVSGPDANNDTRIDYVYNQGQIDIWVDGDKDGDGVWDYGSKADFKTRVNTDDAGFNDGLMVASFDLVSGLGHTFLDFAPGSGDEDNQGSGEFLFKATFLDDNFWYLPDGTDILDYIFQVNWFMASTDYNVDDPLINPGTLPVLFTANVTHDGTIDFDVIPEPATMLLLGSGLIGLVGISRKKKFFKKN